MTTVLLATFLGGLITPGEHEAHGFARHFDLARRPEFRCVGFFRIGPKASAVWIYDDYVLTLGEAAFESDGTLRKPTDCEFVLTDGDGAEHAYRGKYWIVPNILRETVGTKAVTHNLAVLRLDRKVSIPGAGPAILAFGKPGPGEEITCVGFGQRGLLNHQPDLKKFGSGSSDEPARALAFRSRINGDASGDVLEAGPRSIKELSGAAGPGDEGGGVFGYQRGEWRLVGLMGPSQPDSQTTTVVAVGPQARPILKGVVQGQWADFLGISGQQPGSL